MPRWRVRCQTTWSDTAASSLCLARELSVRETSFFYIYSKHLQDLKFIVCKSRRVNFESHHGPLIKTTDLTVVLSCREIACSHLGLRLFSWLAYWALCDCGWNWDQGLNGLCGVSLQTKFLFCITCEDVLWEVLTSRHHECISFLINHVEWTKSWNIRSFLTLHPAAYFGTLLPPAVQLNSLPKKGFLVITKHIGWCNKDACF